MVPAGAEAFARKAAAAGVDVKVLHMPYAEHAFDLRYGSIGNQFVRQSLVRFLAAHGLTP